MLYCMGSYDVDDPEKFQRYPAKVLALLPKHGGRVLAFDTAAFVVEGSPRTVYAILAFPSKAAVLALHHGPHYQDTKPLRHSSTSNCTMVLAEELVGF